MAGQSGQPAPKPSQLPSPVPNEDPGLDNFDPGLDGFDTGALDSAELPVPEDRGMFDVSAQGLAQGALDALPTIGGMVGGGLGFAAGGGAGILGGPAAPATIPAGAYAGGVAGAAAGGALGYTLKTEIEKALFGQQPSRDQYYTGLAGAATDQATGEAIGMGLGQVAGKIAKSKAGKAAGEWVAEKISGPASYMKNMIEERVGEVTKPLMEVLGRKTTPLNTEQSGDVIKQLFTNNIKQRYGKFIDAYDGLDAVAKSVPFTDKSRYNFTQKIKSDALEKLGGDDLRIVRKFADQIDSVGNGAQIDNIAKQIRDASRQAYQTGATSRSKMLKDLADQVDDFLESETTKLAKKVSTGEASPAEVAVIQQMMQQRGIQDDPIKYAKSVAKDYLTNRDTVREEYRVFKSFLEDVGEQAKLRSNGAGPTRFLNDLNDIPSEKLVERMFDPKNAAALRRMQTATPEVFDQVVKSKMSEIMRTSSPEGKLDIKAVRKAINKLPPSTRNFLMKSDEMKIMDAVLDDPKIKRLENLEKLGANFLDRWGGSLAELSGVATEKAVEGGAGVLQRKVPQQIVGRGVRKTGSSLVEAFGNKEEQ